MPVVVSVKNEGMRRGDKKTYATRTYLASREEVDGGEERSPWVLRGGARRPLIHGGVGSHSTRHGRASAVLLLDSGLLRRRPRK